MNAPEIENHNQIMVIKRSVTIRGHRTSVSLESAFWYEIKRIAEAKGKSMNKLIAEIDEERKGNLSSALRLFVLKDLKKD